MKKRDNNHDNDEDWGQTRRAFPPRVGSRSGHVRLQDDEAARWSLRLEVVREQMAARVDKTVVTWAMYAKNNFMGKVRACSWTAKDVWPSI